MIRVALDLTDEQDLDLKAFCEVFYDANRSEVIRRAVASFITKEVGATSRRREYEAARRKLGGEPVRLVPTTELDSSTKVAGSQASRAEG